MKKREFGFLPLLLALIVITSVILLAYAYLQSSVGGREQRAQQLEHSQMAEEAMTEYKTLVEFLSSPSVLRNQFEEEYSEAMIGQLRLLYQLERYDEAIELADICIQEDIHDLAAAFFWSGNAYFQKGIHEEMMEDAFAWFNRSQDQYRRSLEKDSEQRWNIRFNYELVRTALEQAEQDQDDKPVKVLRPRDQIEQADTKVAG
jgi:tetratricopeptide (TPR) repeat protein